MKSFRVWSNYWGKYATEAELHMDGSVDAIFEDADGVPHHENTDLVVEFDSGLKDKNVKEIYEGDIVDCKFVYDKRYKCRGLIINREDKACYAIKDIFGLTDEEVELYRLTAQRNLEVIGNIHENPELLEEKE